MRLLRVHRFPVVLTGAFFVSASFWSQSLALAQSVDAGADRTNFDYSLRVDFPAVITREISRDQIEVRGGNNHIYRVTTSRDSDHFPLGASIRVAGLANGLDVEEAYLLERFEDEQPTSTDKFQKPVDVDFSATITGVDLKRDRAIVKGDDGNQYRLRGDDVEDYKIGDHVRIRGAFRYGVVEIRTLDLIDDQQPQ